jgi:hypothetical protein
MKDLFASLVDRSLARMPVLERRQPTLFEPALDAAVSAELQEKENFVESETPTRPLKQSAKNPAPQPSSKPEEPEAPAVETRPARRQRIRETPTPEQDVVTTHLASVSSAPVTEPKATRPEEPVKPSVIAAPKPQTLTPERTIETIVEKTIEREVIKEQATEEPAIKEIQTFTHPHPQPQTLHRDEGKPAPQPPKVEVKHLPAPKEAPPIKPLVPKSPIRSQPTPPKMRAVSRADSKRPATPPAPVINVTIGRVEVRATAPMPTKAQTARPAGPKLSLDDYLRSRARKN